MRELKVIKKDGLIEPFSTKKFVDSCKKMGLPDVLAKEVAYKVVQELYKVKSTQIRNLVLNYLKQTAPELAKETIQYDLRKREKEKPQFVSII